MRVSVDRAGRVVIPKPLRIALGISANTELDLVPDGAGLRLDVVRPRDRPVTESDGLPVLGFIPGVSFTDDDVRRLRDDLQR